MKPSIIFFGNGPLADYTLEVLSDSCNILFHARTKEDLATVKSLKSEHPEAHGILASFGVMVKSDVLNLFEPEGILNIHPSLLPDLRGPSPIESAILRGDTSFSVSVMKLVRTMDAGPVFYQTTLENLPLDKTSIYRALATTGATWLVEHLSALPTPIEQSGEPTFCAKFDKSMSLLTPETDSASVTYRKIVAFQGFPKPKYTFFGQNCIILEAHPLEVGETALLPLTCSDGQILAIDRLQPENKRPMDAKSLLNGYGK